MSLSMLNRLLSEIERGCVRLVLSDEPARVLDEPDGSSSQQIADEGPSPQFVGCVWESLPVLAELIPDVLDALAETALACWPNWYTDAPQSRFSYRAEQTPELSELLAVSALRQARVPVLEPWLRAAIDCCRAGRVPRPAGFADAIQAAQLALAIDPARLILLLAVTRADQSPDRLDGLARAAEWFARATGAPVAVVVPNALADNAALDSISFDALRTDGAAAWNPRRAIDTANVDGPSSSGTTPPQPSPPPERSRLLVWPLQGVPHPRSEGEQRLAERLRQDDELAALFEFNQSVTTNRDSQHTVDLLWRAGRIVVEIDGYRWHSSREMFARDRQRDYELTISGFLVLRLTHEEVVRDVGLAVEKIRDLVRFRGTRQWPVDRSNEKCQ
ncbi:DUF559 domain-containing protein [bacterium]|nr:DUF559 domain-containing protein [bacterium]